MKKIIYLLLPFLLSCGSQSDLNITNKLNSNDNYCFKSIESDVTGVDVEGFTKVFNLDSSREITYGTFKKGSTIIYRFKSSYISIYGYKGPNAGNISIYIDGQPVGNFSCISEVETNKGLICTIDNLTSDYHDIKIKVSSEDKWVAIDYFEIKMPISVYQKYYNYALVGNIVTNRPNPTGGGNRDLNVIRNEKIYPIGVGGFGALQYDSFAGSGENNFYIGYTFEQVIPISKFVYQTGDTWVQGGWFKNGLIIEAYINSSWVEVTSTNNNLYPVSNNYDDHVKNGIYYYYFENLYASGIRIRGDAGGSDNFVSVSQLEVYCSKEAKSYAEGALYTDEIHFE